MIGIIMRNQDEIKKRIESWLSSKEQFFPDPFYISNIDRIVVELCEFVDDNLWIKNRGIILKEKSRFRKKKNLWVEKESNVAKAIPVSLERDWALGKESEGALKRVIWAFLTSELHDAECNMKEDNSDIILEGIGNPPDINNIGRKFQFWLRLINCLFEDKREAANLSIEIIWILYPEPSLEKYILNAQDNTLSGLLWFTCDDYEYRMWNHTPGKGKKSTFLN
jgi:hypothetical protein